MRNIDDKALIRPEEEVLQIKPREANTEKEPDVVDW